MDRPDIYTDGATPDADARRAMLRDYVIDECVDTIQAAVNMLAALTIEQGEIDIRRTLERKG